MSCNCGNCPKGVKICKQAYIPQVDNTLLECSESGFTNFNCVIKTNAIAQLSLPENSNLNEIFESLLSSIVDLKNRVEFLENQ